MRETIASCRCLGIASRVRHVIALSKRKEKTVMKKGFLTALVIFLSSGPLLADKETDERLANAAKAFTEINVLTKYSPKGI